MSSTPAARASSFRVDGAGDEDVALLVDDPNGERGQIDRDLAEVVEVASSEQSFGAEGGVDLPGLLRRGGQWAGREFVEAEGGRR